MERGACIYEESRGVRVYSGVVEGRAVDRLEN